MRRKSLGMILLCTLLLAFPLTGFSVSGMSMRYRASAANWYEFQPTTWLATQSTSCSVKVHNDAGFIDDGRYSISTNGGLTWTANLTGVQITTLSGNDRRLAVNGLTLPHSATENQNQIKFAILDSSGLPLESPPFVVRVDTVLPSSSVSTSGCYGASWPGAITGLSSDSGSGSKSVEVSIRRDADGLYYNGSSWQASPAWLAAVGASTWSYSFNPGQGSYTVQSRATDNAGNVQSGYGQGVFTYDTVPPTSEVWTSGSFNADSWTGGISGAAGDSGSGLSQCHVTIQRSTDGLYYNGTSWASSPTWLAVTGSAVWSFPFTPPVDATYTVRSRSQDHCGNLQSQFGQSTFTYDAGAPGAPTALVVTPSGWVRTNSFRLDWTNPTDLSGISAAHFKWNAAPTSNEDESPGSPVNENGIDSLSNLAVPSQGAHRLYLWLEDAAGNQSYQNHVATAVAAFRWDAQPPQTTISSINGMQGDGGWYTSLPVEITLSAQDINPDPSVINATSGISATLFRKDSGAWQSGTTLQFATDGTHSLAYYSTDIAGNNEPTVNAEFKIDSAPPTTSANLTGVLGTNGWYTSTVAVNLVAVDATSGISATHYRIDNGPLQTGSSFTISADGEHTISYYSVDLAGNVETAHEETIKIDKTAPVTSFQLQGVQGENNWFIASPVTVTLSTTDVVTGVHTSGIYRLRYRVNGGAWQQYSGAETSFNLQTAAGSEQNYTVEISTLDLAGNAEPVNTVAVGIDLRAPQTINHVPSVSPSGWTNQNCFGISWDENPVDLSGISGVYYSFHLPTSPADGILVLGDNITAISCVQVPEALGDGIHDVFLWLRDKAGNSDHLTRRQVTLRLDRQPPVVSARVAGSLCEPNEWYNSPVQVTFDAVDNVPSGMVGGVISYQVVGGGGWIQGNTYSESNDGRYTIEGRARDAAGNVSDIITQSIKLDKTAPLAPMSVYVVPSAWSNNNAFDIHWLNPGDLSGLAGVRYKQGSPPVSPMDGTYVDGSRNSLTAIASEAEGETPLYLWLVDKACNNDHQQRTMVTLRWDTTPPTTTFTSSGTVGGDGWYTSAAHVTLGCTDGASGCASNHYQISGGEWQDGNSFDISAEGVITFSYYSKDVAGNAETPKTASVKVDGVPPSSHAVADSYSKSTSFTVQWTGVDKGSGIASYDVQYRVGPSGAWQNWVTAGDPANTSKTFTEGVLGKTYYFRTRARDKAGNVEPYPSTPDVYVSVDPLLNGDFEQGSWLGWERTGACLPQLTVTEGYAGQSTRAVVLGCPNQGDGVPPGPSMIGQTLALPSAQDLPRPVLRFRYRIFTYDVLWSEFYQRFYDRFNVGFGPPGGIEPTYVFTDGNRTQNYGQLLDLGWKEGTIDLRPYAGQTIKICLTNNTVIDEFFNTWTIVDDVRIVNLEHGVSLPIILRTSPITVQSGGVARPAARDGTKPPR